MEFGSLLTVDFPGTDARFPNMNQTKHCWQNYVDYHKCIIAKGEDFAPCRQVVVAGLAVQPSELITCSSGWHTDPYARHPGTTGGTSRGVRANLRACHGFA